MLTPSLVWAYWMCGSMVGLYLRLWTIPVSVSLDGIGPSGRRWLAPQQALAAVAAIVRLGQGRVSTG